MALDELVDTELDVLQRLVAHREDVRLRRHGGGRAETGGGGRSARAFAIFHREGSLERGPPDRQASDSRVKPPSLHRAGPEERYEIADARRSPVADADNGVNETCEENIQGR